MRHFRLVLLTISLTIFIQTALFARTGCFFQHDEMSSSLISKVCQDKYGFIWVGTEYGLNRFDGYHFTQYLHHEGDTTTVPDNEVTAFAVSREGRLYVGFSKGLAYYDYATNVFITIHFPNGVKPRVSTLTHDRSGNLLVGTAGYGLYKMIGDKPVLDNRYYREGMSNYYSRMVIDSHGTMWCTSNEPGLIRITPSNGKQRPQRKVFYTSSGQIVDVMLINNTPLAACNNGLVRYDSRTHKLVNAGYDLSAWGHELYIDRVVQSNGNIYITSTGNGLGVINKGTRTLKPIYVPMSNMDMRSARLRDICRDRYGNLWLACYRQGLLMLTNANTAFQSWNFATQNIPSNSTLLSIAPFGSDVICALLPSGIYRFNSEGQCLEHMAGPSGVGLIHRDKKGQYWLGVGKILFKYEPTTGKYTKILTTEGQAIKDIKDNDDKLYISSLGRGLYIYDTRTHATSAISMYNTKRRGGTVINDWIMDMNVDSKGLLWLATTDGVSCFNPKTDSFLSQGWNVILQGMACQAIAFTNKGNVVIGTAMGLWLYDRRHRKVEKFPKSEQLDNNSISAIVTDHNGDLWLSTMDGIWQWDHKTGSFIGHISGNGLTTKEYWAHVMFHDANDRIGFGTPDGITTFYPDNVRHSHSYTGTIYVTNVMIGGKQMGILSDTYDVANGENTVAIDFSLLNYRYSDNTIFQYRLNKGRWITTDNYSNAVTFNRLPYGDYILEVRAMSNGKMVAPVKRIMLSVAPPWYLTNDAFMVYGIIVIMAVAAIIIIYGRKKQRELEEAKMRFLINATHDIRSPLTLIIGPLKKLRARITDQESQQDLETIERNANRLQTLVGQILDKRRIDKQQLQLHCRKTDLVQFTSAIIALYSYNAQQRHINLTFTHPERVDVWIDRTNFDKVVANILSNAFKYTPDGGEININIRIVSSVSTKDGDGSVELSITDSGSGFGDANLKHIFDRFYQGDNSRSMHVGGTGIGLNLCRAITRMHGGQIEAANRKDGHTGAIIKVTLPMGYAHLKPEQIDEEKEKDKEAIKHKQANRNIHLMVVDDDHELAAYIKSELADWYRTDIFPNGKAALDALLKGKYDVVVSDVMMPEMDGLEMLKAIKSNSNISDIPVILLTSKSEVVDRLEGLRRGADAYIAKPFNMEVLHATIDNVVDNVRRLRGKFSGIQAGNGMAEDIEVKGNDDALMERIMNSINKNMDNSDYNVEQLCKDVGVSRTQLHRKMKEIAGVSTSEFIRNLRLEQAAKLLREGKINITQVAYAVGFNNSAHFSTVFKKHFGVSPSEYSEKKD